MKKGKKRGKRQKMEIKVTEAGGKERGEEDRRKEVDKMEKGSENRGGGRGRNWKGRG